ncbi:FAD-binding domain-containing protein [Biscogniauxia marginata]|nr:FAD-binding domain-containing protein [Biscogniauxia marginata]
MWNNNLLVPSDPQYQAYENSYWSNTAKLKPACIIRPGTPEQVSAALRALVDADEKFAVRSGGHAPLARTNNIHDGVTVDLSLLDSVRFDEASETVTFGPGVRWRHVCREVEKHGRAVAGGREIQTGVAGLLLGGGNSWMTGRKGFACDNVVSYQVVLADGQAITVDNQTHTNLFRALKGGSNNFGIGGVTITPKEYVYDAIRITSNFTEKVKDYPDASIITDISYMPEMKDFAVVAAIVETRGVENSLAFEEWSTLPKITDTTKLKTLSDMGAETALPANYYTTWFSISIKNDTRIMAKGEEIHAKLVKDLESIAPRKDFITQCIFQPLPVAFAANSTAAGGNMLGLERNASDGLIFQLNTMVQTAEQRELVYPKVKAYVTEVREFAVTIDGGLLDWVYMNYADETQDVLRGYGAKNVKFMKDVAVKYDPDQIFQKLCLGGFKLSNIE